MVERLLLALLIVAGAYLSYRLYQRWALRRNAQESLGLEGYFPGRPAVLYFSSPTCLPCQRVQKPALRQLSAMYGERLQVIEIDATEQPEAADSWGVLSLPTTFLIDAQGRPRRVNHGVARREKLIAQLREIGEPPSLSPTGVDGGVEDQPDLIPRAGKVEGSMD